MNAKTLLKVTSSLLLIPSALAAGCKIRGNKNTRLMNRSVNDGIEQIRKHCGITQLNAGEYADLRFYGIMKFHTDQYLIEQLGNLSVMTASMGFMQMVSFVITPFEKNVPMCTLDFMYIFRKRKSYVEFYDLTADTQTAEYQEVISQLKALQAKYAGLKDVKTKANWYDNLLSVFMHKEISGNDADTVNDALFQDVIRTYMDIASALPVSSAEDQEKQLENTQAYFNGLIDKGGVSTNVFKKALGTDKTRDFFGKVFFGTALFSK